MRSLKVFCSLPILALVVEANQVLGEREDAPSFIDFDFDLDLEDFKSTTQRAKEELSKEAFEDSKESERVKSGQFYTKDQNVEGYKNWQTNAVQEEQGTSEQKGQEKIGKEENEAEDEGGKGVRDDCRWGWCKSGGDSKLTFKEFVQKSKEEAELNRKDREKQELKVEEEERRKKKSVSPQGDQAKDAAKEGNVSEEEEQVEDKKIECQPEKIYIYENSSSGAILVACIVFFVLAMAFLYYSPRFRRNRPRPYETMLVADDGRQGQPYGNKEANAETAIAVPPPLPSQEDIDQQQQQQQQSQQVTFVPELRVDAKEDLV